MVATKAELKNAFEAGQRAPRGDYAFETYWEAIQEERKEERREKARTKREREAWLRNEVRRRNESPHRENVKKEIGKFATRILLGEEDRPATPYTKD